MRAGTAGCVTVSAFEDPDEDLLVVRGDNWISAEELDQEIDTALRLEALQQQDVQEQEP